MFSWVLRVGPRFAVAVAAATLLAGAVDGASGARAEENEAISSGEEIGQRIAQTHNLFRPCDGDCAVLVNIGPWLETPLHELHPLSNNFKAPWQYEYYDAGIVSISLSRRLITIRNMIEIAPEIGFAKRFGDGQSEEVWGSVNFRVRNFPWDDVVRTTVSFGFGANYAFRLDPLEDERDSESDLEHLLIYLAPEITLGLPRLPQADFVMRLHHRSGGRDFGFDRLWGSNEGGASNFLTAGIRWRF